MSLWRALFSFLATAGLSWDDLNPKSSAANHGHPLGDIGMDMPSLVQLAEALGGGIYPGMGSGQSDTMPMVDSVAPGFPLNLPFLVPANQVKQQLVRLSFQPQAFRTYVTGSTGAGSLHQHIGDIVQNLSITIGDDSPGHQHKMLLYQGNVGADAGGQWQKFIMDDQTGGINHREQVWLHTDNGITADIWTDSATAPTPTHQHTNVAHTHTPTNTGGEQTHTHSPTNGVQEGTSPDAMHVIVDGTDVTTQLGGPFTGAQTEIEIGPYVAAGTGLHQVQITSTTNLGRVAGWVRSKRIENNLGTAA